MSEADSGDNTGRAELRFYSPDWMEGIAPRRFLSCACGWRCQSFMI